MNELQESKDVEISAISNPKPYGIGGWLIFPLINLAILPIFTIVYYVKLFQYSDFVTLYNSAISRLFILELIGNIVAVIIAIFLCYLCYKKSNLFPPIFIIFLILYSVFQIKDIVIGESLNNVANTNNPSDIFATVRIIGYAILWTIYILVSKRVKNTFIVKSPINLTSIKKYINNSVFLNKYKKHLLHFLEVKINKENSLAFIKKNYLQLIIILLLSIIAFKSCSRKTEVNYYEAPHQKVHNTSDDYQEDNYDATYEQ